jgi:hypothetical protein
VSFLLTFVLPLQAPVRRPASPALFKTTLTADVMTNKQAVIETASGNIVIDLASRPRAESGRRLHQHHLLKVRVVPPQP